MGIRTFPLSRSVVIIIMMSVIMIVIIIITTWILCHSKDQGVHHNSCWFGGATQAVLFVSGTFFTMQGLPTKGATSDSQTRILTRIVVRSSVFCWK
jgi:hypothetical protein